MTACPANTPAPFRCPTKWEVLQGLLALLPRGRAWQSDEGGAIPAYESAFDPLAFDSGAFQTASNQGTILWRFWSAVADVFTFLNDRLCALRLEFFCATQTETRDLWMREYGLPDACDPFPDLCTKVAAQGGARCEFFNRIAAQAGWTVDCIDSPQSCGDRVGCSRAGHARAGRRFAYLLELIVHTGESPAYTGGPQTPPRAGRFRAGQPISCGPDIAPLRCLMDRIAPAHVTISYLFA